MCPFAPQGRPCLPGRRRQRAEQSWRVAGEWGQQERCWISTSLHSLVLSGDTDLAFLLLHALGVGRDTGSARGGSALLQGWLDESVPPPAQQQHISARRCSPRGCPHSPPPTSMQIPNGALLEWSQPSWAPKSSFVPCATACGNGTGQWWLAAGREDGECMAFPALQLDHLVQHQ